MTLRRGRAWGAALGGLFALAGCGGAGAASGPHDPPPQDSALAIPPFVFMADSNGLSHLYRYRNDSIARLTAAAGNDMDPQSAAGRLVFASDRDGNVEVYIGDLDLATSRRVTKSTATDEQPALNPRGDTIAFVSNRSGVPRLWTVAAPGLADTGYETPAPLATGTPSYVPEQSPAWSPDGRQIAFTSVRGAASQVLVVPAGGGSAIVVTHESGGAFSPVWSADGSAILFVSATDGTRIRRVVLATGETTDVAADPLGVGAPSCDAALCLAVTDPGGGAGSIIALATSGARRQVVLDRARNERHPAILAP